jgi:hypothetical protein
MQGLALVFVSLMSSVALFLIASGCVPTQKIAKVPELKYIITKDNQPDIRAIDGPFEVSTDNCGNQVSTLGNFSQSQQFTTDFELDASQGISEQLGGEIAAKDTLSAEVERSLGIQLGVAKTAEENRQVIVPADAKTVIRLQWEQIWTQGTIHIERADGTQVGEVPFSVLDSVRLIQLSEEALPCPGTLTAPTDTPSPAPLPTPTDTASPHTPIYTPSPTPLPTAAHVPSATRPSTSASMVAPAPKPVEYDGMHFVWEWAGQNAVSNENWYFDVKFYTNIFSELPYDALVVEPASAQYVERKWQYSFEGTLYFQCGSFWTVQIAKRNPDGSFAGFLSPESERLPTKQGCGASDKENIDLRLVGGRQALSSPAAATLLGK